MHKIKIPHSFSFNGDNYVCFIGEGKTTGILGYGKTKREAFNNLIENKKRDLELSDIRFGDWLQQFRRFIN